MKNIFKQISILVPRVLFFLILLFLSAISYSQINIVGQQIVCQNESEIYEIQNATQGIVYSWTITPSIGTINQITNEQVVIQWNAPGSCTIQVTGGGNSVTHIVQINKTNKPTIVYNNEVGCQQVHIEFPFQDNEIIDDENDCINVCENSVVEYVSHGTLLIGQNISQFKWEVVGGEIVSVDGIAQAAGTVVGISGTLFIPNGIYSKIEVKWGSIGIGILKVTELTPYATPNYTNPTNCGPKTTTICVDIIEKPQSNFLVDNQQIPQCDCYNICLNKTVNFIDISTASINSPILFWQWNFGDGSPHSHQQNPSHTYTQSGNYEVTLLVTNRCNCTSEYFINICVDELPAPNMECPSVVCENDKAKYTLDANCSSYKWTVSGGTKLSQNDPEIEVIWDNVSSSGYGYLSIDGQYCDDVCPTISVFKIPIILQNGTIEGPATTCVNKIYKFELPTWSATNFDWSITNNTSGATFSTLWSREYFVEIESGSNGGSFDLTCNYQNTITKSPCSGSATIHIDVLAQPEIVTNSKHCINSAIPCTLAINSIPATLTGNVEWTITDPYGGFQTFTSNSNPYTFPANIYSVPGKYRISANSMNSEFCEPEFTVIDIVDIPPIPTDVFGDDVVYLNIPYTYSSDVIDNTIMHWSLIGANTPLNSEGHTRTISWNTTSAKSISIYRENEEVTGCISQIFTKSINNISITGAISGLTNTFEDVTDNYTLTLNNGIVPEVIEWIVPPSAGIISAGQGTLNCSITWLHQVNSLNNVLIKCNITKCGQAYTSSIFVNIDKSAETTSITATPSPVCSGTATAFTVNSTGAPVNEYIIDFGDGNTQNITSPTSNTFSHTYINSGTTSISYPAKIKVRSSNNNMVTSTQVYTITVNPIPNITLSPVNTVIPPASFPVQLSVASSVSTGNSYQWHFTEHGSIGNINVVSSINTYNVNSTPPTGASSSFGNYWCIVTNSFGCSNETNKASVQASSPSTNCTGVAPKGITNMPAPIISSNTNPCGSGIQVNCTTAGTLGGNIVSYNWSVDPTNHHSSSGTSTQNQSPVYSFYVAGIYQIKLSVDYVNTVSGDPPCTYQKACNVTVPMVADMEWGLSCNYTGNGYEIKLIDNSTLIPTYTLSSREWNIYSGTTLITTINALTNPNYTYTVPSAYLGTTLDIKLTITNVQQGSSVICSKTESVSIPNLPVADFSMITTYPNNPSNPYKSCEGREVAFMNNSSVMADIHTHKWLFVIGGGNPPQSNMVNTSYTYDVNINSSFTPSLTVTDNHGCWDTKTEQIQVFKNSFAKIPFSPEYTPSTKVVCPDLIINPPIQPNFSGGFGNLTYRWHKGTTILTNAITQNLAYAYEGSGAYWVKINDMHNCYLNLNPTPAMVSVNVAPTTIVVGKTDVCDNEPILSYKVKTGMSNNANLSYSWNLNGTTLGSTTKEIQLYPSALNTGVNQLLVTVTDLSTGGCSTTSSPFLIELHSVPQSLAITSPIAVDCSTYELSLTGSATSLSTPLTYNWSTGVSGQTVSVFNGGAYRLWVLDKYGCKSYTDRTIQYPPDFYFWRFPIGCYFYCEEDMPKTVWPSTWTYGVANIMFSDWAWIHNGANVVINGPSSGGCIYGSNSGTSQYSLPCRLWIDNPFADPNTGIIEGEGSGDYNWMLNNGLCQQESSIMSVSIEECCELELNIVELRCIQSNPTGNTYYFDISVDNVPCSTQYNLYAVDNNGWPVQINQAYLTPNTINTGQNNISGQFTAQPNTTDIRFFISILCEGCLGETSYEALPSCTGVRLANTDSLFVDSLISNESSLKTNKTKKVSFGHIFIFFNQLIQRHH